MSSKKKDNEIKHLSDKLDSYKNHNKLILDENKKLLEIITIFKQLQEIDSQSTKAQDIIKKKEIKVSQFDKPDINIHKTYINTNREKKGSYGQIYKKKEIVKPSSFTITKPAIESKSYIRVTTEKKKKHTSEPYLHSINNVCPDSKKYYSPNDNNDEIILNEKNVEDFEIEADIHKKEDQILTSYGHEEAKGGYIEVIDMLEKYKQMNERLMKNLKVESENKVNVVERKKSVENLTSVLDYINSIKNLQERKDHVIPFYLVDKNKIYENMMKYIFEKKENTHIQRNISKVFETKKRK
jgi:hypothetical protein